MGGVCERPCPVHAPSLVELTLNNLACIHKSCSCFCLPSSPFAVAKEAWRRTVRRARPLFVTMKHKHCLFRCLVFLPRTILWYPISAFPRAAIWGVACDLGFVSSMTNLIHDTMLHFFFHTLLLVLPSPSLLACRCWRRRRASSAST